MTQIKNLLLNAPIREIHVDTQGECTVCDGLFYGELPCANPV